MNQRRSSQGFTLIELIMVLVLLGVLAIVLVPRISTQDFETRGFYDETLALLRYAQKTAVAQRRTVCVSLNATGVALSIDASTPPDLTCDAPPVLSSNPRGGSGLAGSVASFRFTPLGNTDQSANVLVTIPGNAAITVEAETGYVR